MNTIAIPREFPLRAANARILIEQSIGRGLRLPFGKRTGVKAVDRLNIVAHDKFQEIVDEANRPDSVIRLEQVILEPTDNAHRPSTVIASPTIATLLNGQAVVNPVGNGTVSNGAASNGQAGQAVPPPLFPTAAEQQIAQLTYQAIQRRETLPSITYLQRDEVVQTIVREVRERYVIPSQSALPGLAPTPAPDFTAIVNQVVRQVQQLTIDIPRIVIVPKGEVTTGFHAFELATSNVHFQPVARDLLIQSLQTNQQEAISMGARVASEARLEDYLVRQLVDFPDISYDDHADLLYALAGQMVRHLASYLADEEEVINVLLYYQRRLAEFIHAQMQEHRWEKSIGFEAKVTRGFTTLKDSAFASYAGRPIQDFHTPPADLSKIGQIVYGGFQRCLYAVQKFQSDTERKLAIILERETDKWFKPARGQFQIYYKAGLDQREYVPDFVAETATQLYLLEPKANHEVNTPEVQEKQKAAEVWCQHATAHALQYGGKPWCYVLLPHDLIAENMTLAGLVAQA